MEFSTVTKLEVVTLLDSICYGLVYSFISPYILCLGGDHVVSGVLAVGCLLCNLISADFVNCFNQYQGKLNALKTTLNIAMVSHLLMIFTSNYWITILSRYIYSLVNQSQNMCKNLILQRIPQTEQESYLVKYGILNGAGYIIGPFISGWLFEKHFFYIGWLGATLTYINILILETIPQERRYSQSEAEEISVRLFSGYFKEVALNAIKRIHGAFVHLSKSDCSKNWDLLAIKFLYISSISIFFAKFTQILKNNFQADSVVVGYSISYMNFLNYVGVFLIANIKESFDDYPTLILTKYALQLLITSLFITSYSPLYGMYAIMCIPVIIATSYINSVWKDLFAERNNEDLLEMNNFIGILSGLTVPIAFGYTCNIIGHHAVILFSIVPLILALYITSVGTKWKCKACGKCKDD